MLKTQISEQESSVSHVPSGHPTISRDGRAGGLGESGHKVRATSAWNFVSSLLEEWRQMDVFSLVGQNKRKASLR